MDHNREMLLLLEAIIKRDQDHPQEAKAQYLTTHNHWQDISNNSKRNQILQWAQWTNVKVNYNQRGSLKPYKLSTKRKKLIQIIHRTITYNHKPNNNLARKYSLTCQIKIVTNSYSYIPITLDLDVQISRTRNQNLLVDKVINYLPLEVITTNPNSIYQNKWYRSLKDSKDNISRLTKDPPSPGMQVTLG